MSSQPRPSRRSRSSSSPANGRARARLTRARIVAAASDVAERDGMAGVTLAAVAAQLGVHYTSLYNHVDGLDGLRRAVALAGLQELTEELWSAALGRSGRDALVAVAQAHRRFILEHRHKYDALFIVRDPDDDELATASHRLAEATRAVLRSFGLDDASVAMAHHVLNAAIRGFGLYEPRLFANDPAGADEAFAQLVTLFVDALEAGRWPADRAV